MSLSKRTRAGLGAMPSNAAWLVARVLKPAAGVGRVAESASAGVRDRGRQVSAAVVDAVPIGGDSVDLRMRRAQEAGQRAREAEDGAVQAARESKACADHARRVSERGRAQVREVEREAGRQLNHRIVEAQKAAEESVQRVRQAAQAQAQARRQAVQAEVDRELEDAQGEAEACQQRAEELVEDATEKLAQARRLAVEAAAAARAAAEEANRRAQQLASDTEQQASEAQARVTATERIHAQSPQTAERAARERGQNSPNGALQSYNKPELIELAARIAIPNRSRMTKGQLVDAIAKASNPQR